MANQRRLSTAGQTHDAENLTSIDLKGDVGDAHDCIELFEHFGFAQSVPADIFYDLGGPIAEDLPYSI